MNDQIPPRDDCEPEEPCVDGYPEHDWEPGDPDCRRCGADLSEWNEE